MLLSLAINAQTIDFGAFKGKPFKIGGGVSATSTFFESNRDNRQPFTYNLTGNLNFSFYSFTMPITYNISNAGNNLDYKIPFDFNRISISPKYKWATLHLGDVNMTFSPYTLAGHQFRGVGVELNPNSPLKFSAMYGRLLKAVEDDDNPKTIPSFLRMGYGTKLAYEKQNYKVGVIGFYAKDDINSIAVVPDKKNVVPKENLVIGLTAESQVSKVLKLSAEYSNSTINQDLRAQNSDSKKGLAGIFLKNKTSAQNFSALKVGFDFRFDKMVLGTSYERVDPNYQTLGAYYFANDLENVMINASRPFLKDKLTLAFNFGIQRDNLDNKKSATTKRFVGTMNATAKFSEQLMTNFTYSNQSTTTNVNPDQFFQINISDPQLSNIDQLNYRQLSQNASVNTNYNFKPTEVSKKNIVVNYSFNQVANEQAGIIRLGQLSSFHNINMAYNHGLVKSQWNFSSSINYTLNTIGVEDSKTYGPTLGVNKKFFKDKFNTQFSAAYNISESKQSKGSNTGLRFNAGYVYQDNHNLTLTASQLLRNSSGGNSLAQNINELTVVLGYAYNFSAKKSKNTVSSSEKALKQKQEERVAKLVKSEFNEDKIEGNAQRVSSQIFDTINSAKRLLNATIDAYVKSQKAAIDATSLILAKTQNKDSIQIAKNTLKKQIEDLDIKWKQFITFDNQFQNTCKLAYAKLKSDSKQGGLSFESKYFVRKYNIKIADEDSRNLDFSDIETYIKENKIELNKRDKGRLAHFYLLSVMAETKSDEDFLNKPEMQQLFEREKENQYQLFLKKTKLEELINKLEIKIADFYMKNYIATFK
jgi:hypothetical protein